MEEHVTLVQPDASPTGGSRHVTLPADLLEQVRGRVRLLALLLLVTFSFDPVLHFIALAVVLLAGQPIPPDAPGRTSTPPAVWPTGS